MRSMNGPCIAVLAVRNEKIALKCLVKKMQRKTLQTNENQWKPTSPSALQNGHPRGATIQRCGQIKSLFFSQCFTSFSQCVNRIAVRMALYPTACAVLAAADLGQKKIKINKFSQFCPSIDGRPCSVSRPASKRREKKKKHLKRGHGGIEPPPCTPEAQILPLNQCPALGYQVGYKTEVKRFVELGCGGAGNVRHWRSGVCGSLCANSRLLLALYGSHSYAFTWFAFTHSFAFTHCLCKVTSGLHYELGKHTNGDECG